MIQFVNKKCIPQTDTWAEKIPLKKKGKTKNIRTAWNKSTNKCNVSSKEKTPTEFLNVCALNTLSRVKSECLQSQKKSTSVSPNWISQNHSDEPVRWKLGGFFFSNIYNFWWKKKKKKPTFFFMDYTTAEGCRIDWLKICSNTICLNKYWGMMWRHLNFKMVNKNFLCVKIFFTIQNVIYLLK